MFEIGFPWVFWLAPLPIVVFLILPSLKTKMSGLIFPNIQSAAGVANTKLRKGAWISKRNFFQWMMLLLIWACFLGALSSPQLVGEPQVKVKTARSFVIAADISFSMATRDWVVDGKRLSRWEAVKSLLDEFIGQREGDRLALIFFGTNAYLQAPLTTDLEVVQNLLDETEVGMAGQMTGIGKAIGFAVELFKRDTLEQKVMLLLTDGVDAGKGVAPLDAAHLAHADSIKIYTMGIGDPFQPGADLDEGTLKKIASVTEGEYFLAMDTKQLEKAYESLNELEPMEFEEESYKPVTRLFYYPLLAGIGLAFLLLLVRIVVNLIRRMRYDN
ncbi:MAG: VWA domain-containing protein [Reichenbachiella sp.]